MAVHVQRQHPGVAMPPAERGGAKKVVGAPPTACHVSVTDDPHRKACSEGDVIEGDVQMFPSVSKKPFPFLSTYLRHISIGSLFLRQMSRHDMTREFIIRRQMSHEKVATLTSGPTYAGE